MTQERLKKENFMKGLIFVLLLLSAFIILTGCSLQNETPAYPQYKIRIPSVAGEVPEVAFELNKTLPVFPDNAMVYRTVKPEVTPELVADIGAKLGLSGKGTYSPQEAAYHISNNKNILISVYSATGAITLSTDKLYSKELFDAHISPELPSFEEAAVIATEFLNQRGWLPAGVTVDEVKIGGRTGITPDHLAVSFDYRIDGHRVTGPGDKYNVRIAHKGEVAQMMINPVKYTPHETSQIKTVEQAFHELKENRKYAIPIETRKVKIDSVSTEYWLESMQEGQKYIIPVFTFKGQCTDSNDKILENRFTAWVEAIK
jgi:hypothetical protein